MIMHMNGTARAGFCLPLNPIQASDTWQSGQDVRLLMTHNVCRTWFPVMIRLWIVGALSKIIEIPIRLERSIKSYHLKKLFRFLKYLRCIIRLKKRAGSIWQQSHLLHYHNSALTVVLLIERPYLERLMPGLINATKPIQLSTGN